MTRTRFETMSRAFGLAFVLCGGLALGAAHAQDKPAAAPEPAAAAKPAAATADTERPIPPRNGWSFWGPFGSFDEAQLQRGFRVYKEVCSACHQLKIPFRTLSQPYGPGFSESQVKALAATYQVADGPNDAGEMFQRPGRPSDYFPPPFANVQAARAALGGAPPDMSLLAKARTYERGFPLFLLDPIIQFQEQGPDYIVAIMKGYTHDDDPQWNEYFPGHHIAMPKPLADGQVEYTDGSPQTIDQYAHDVSAFLTWASEPSMVERKKFGLRVVAFLIVLAGLLFFVKKRIWAKVGGDVVVGA